MIRLALLNSAILIALVAGANAQALCFKPTEPRCINAFGTFDDQWSFDRCKRDMSTFVDETKSYTDCLNRESEEAIREANAAVARFNCKARKEIVCR